MRPGPDRRLRERGLRFELSAAERRAQGGPLEGKTFVLTGTLPGPDPRGGHALIRRAGGKVTGSVSKGTDYVVAGDSPGSKLAKAEELGTTVLDEEGCEAAPQLRLRQARPRLAYARKGHWRRLCFR